MHPALHASLYDDACRQSGWIPFDQFMERALYHPQAGYYSEAGRPDGPFGPTGDFVTAAGLGPWMGWAIAKRFQRLERMARLQGRGKPCLREFGPGNGALMQTVLEQLGEWRSLPQRVELVERSAGLRKHQEARLSPFPIEVVWLDRLEEEGAQLEGLGGFEGLVLANEVADALPTKVFEWAPNDPQGPVLEWGLAWDSKDGWSWASRRGEERLTEVALRRHADLGQWGPWMAGHRGEWSPWLAPWARSLADGLAWGELVIADYGYERVELDHPDRHRGTLTAHHRHQRIDDWPTWLAHAGDMDLTAHVDFSELADVLSDGGLNLCLQTQAAWLIDQGLIEEAHQRLFGQETRAGGDPSIQVQPESMRMLGQLQTLLSDADMGQRFLVLTASRGLEEAT